MLLLVYDTETNGLGYLASVIMASALLVEFADSKFTVKEKFSRYYQPLEVSETHKHYAQFKEGARGALVFHEITEAVIAKKRQGCAYPPFFALDKDIKCLVKRADYVVGHNVSFDLRMSGFAKDTKTFDTMHSNTKHCKIPSSKHGYKRPNLKETAEFYGITVSGNKQHNAWYDICITYQIVLKMYANQMPELLEILC